MPVVVVIADRDALSPSGAAQAGFVRDVGESSIVVVAVETIGGFGRRSVQACAANDEDIGPPVVVVVEEGDAAGGGLGEILNSLIGAVDGGVDQARLLGNVGEPRGPGTSGRLRARRGLHVARGDSLPERAAAAQREEESGPAKARSHRGGAGTRRGRREKTKTDQPPRRRDAENTDQGVGRGGSGERRVRVGGHGHRAQGCFMSASDSTRWRSRSMTAALSRRTSANSVLASASRPNA